MKVVCVMMAICSVLVVCRPSSNGASSTGRAAQMRDAKSIKYLKQYGYLQNLDEYNPRKVKAALKRFQRMANINETGDITVETVEAMSRPRCSVPDEVPGDEAHPRNRSRRFVLQGSKWLRRHLSYKVIKYSDTSTLTQAQQDAAFREALDYWSAVTSLTFTALSCEPVDIAIALATGYHPQFLGDRNRFDGRGKVLAHAFYPICRSGTTVEALCGDAHFDDSEAWVTEFMPGKEHLTKVAGHEFGHSLGLAHSTDSSAIMYPFIINSPPVGPQSDDINGIRAIYGDENTVYSVPGVVDEVPTCPTSATTLPVTTTTSPANTITPTTITTTLSTPFTTLTTTSKTSPNPKYCPYRENHRCRRWRPRASQRCKRELVRRLCPYMCRVCKVSERLSCADDPFCHKTGACVYMGTRPSKKKCASKAYNYGKDRPFCHRSRGRQTGKCQRCYRGNRGIKLCPQMCSACPP